MRRMRFTALFLFLPLAGCNTPDAALLAVSCPATAVLAQAASVTKLRPGGNDAANVILVADMSPAQLSCDYEDGAASSRVDLRFPITLTRGPAAAGEQTLTYFVAVLDATGNILSKRLFQRAVDLGGRNAVVLTEQVSGTMITLPAGSKPYQYQVLTGFQLSPEELAYNQTRRNFRP